MITLTKADDQEASAVKGLLHNFGLLDSDGAGGLILEHNVSCAVGQLGSDGVGRLLREHEVVVCPARAL